MKTNSSDKLYLLLEKRWKDFFYVYIKNNDDIEISNIPREIIDKFNLEIKPFSSNWSENDPIICDIIDAHIRTYWQNQILERQEKNTVYFSRYIKLSIITFILSLIVIVFMFLSVKFYNNKSQKEEFYNNLITYKFFDHCIETDEGVICKINGVKIIFKE